MSSGCGQGCGQVVFRVWSEFGQGVVRVWSGCSQSVVREWSGCGQGVQSGFGQGVIQCVPMCISTP